MKPGKLLTVIAILFANYHIFAEVIIRSVPTFENASIYIEGTKLNPSDLSIEYKHESEKKWTKGHKLINSQNDPTPRTSILNIQSDSNYNVRCLDSSGKELAKAIFQTWQEDVPIKKTIKLNDVAKENGALILRESGTAEGWIKYIGDKKDKLECGDLTNQAVLIENQKYIILENATIHGGKRHGISVIRSEQIRIKNCDISDFGRLGKQDLKKDGKYYTEDGKAINYDAGVYIWESQKLVVENCFVHDPRNHANSWLYSHPAGPNGIFVKSNGQMVFRYNDFIGSNSHRWNDAIEGYGNGKKNGGFNQDSDIYGNYIAFCNDDGIELDGDQCNVRFYGNKIEGALCGVSTAPNLRGPSFVFRNLIVNLGDERGSFGSCIKNGGGSTHTIGTTFFYHNTFFTNGNGIASVGFGKAKNRSMFFGVSRNNILCVSGKGIKDDWSPIESDFNYDYLSTPTDNPGTITSLRQMETKAKSGPVDFLNAVAGDFSLSEKSSAKSGATAIEGLTNFTSFGANPKSFENEMFPMRPLRVVLDKNQILLRGESDKIQQPNVSTTLTNNTTTPLSFTIYQNTAFDWFSVKPQHGVINAQAKTSLSIMLTDKMEQQTRLLPGAFIVKFENGVSLPVTIYAEVVHTEYTKTFNAIDLKGADSFVKIKDPESMSKACLEFSSGKNKVLELNLEVAKAGEYNIYFRIKCPSPIGSHDSLNIKVNDTKKETYHLPGSNMWIWSHAKDDLSKVQLLQGKNTIEISPREELNLDAIFISTSTLQLGENLNGR